MQNTDGTPSDTAEVPVASATPEEQAQLAETTEPEMSIAELPPHPVSYTHLTLPTKA